MDTNDTIRKMIWLVNDMLNIYLSVLVDWNELKVSRNLCLENRTSVTIPI